MVSELEKVIEFKVRRFDPESNRRYMSTYKVPVRTGVTMLDALLYIKDNLDGTLTFRHSCRMGQCGSCGILVNGKPMLACYTQVLHLGSDTHAFGYFPNYLNNWEDTRNIDGYPSGCKGLRPSI